MILNIVKNGTDSSSILEYVRKTFNNSKVSIKTDYEISVDIEVIGEGGPVSYTHLTLPTT